MVNDDRDENVTTAQVDLRPSTKDNDDTEQKEQ